MGHPHFATWMPWPDVKLFLLLLLAARVARGGMVPSAEELQAVGEDMRSGELDAHGLEVLSANADQNPDDWRAQGMLGQALALQNLPGALDALKAAYRLQPRVGEVSFAFASQLSKVGKTAEESAEAAEAYETALRLSPSLGDANAYLQLGRAHAGAEDPQESAPAVAADDKAVAAWSHARKLAPAQVDICLLLAARLAHGTRAQRRSAIKVATAAVKLAPDSATAYDLLGAALHSIGTGVGTKLSAAQRQRMVRSLRTALSLRRAQKSDTDGGEVGDSAASTAQAHSRLAWALSDFSAVLDAAPTEAAGEETPESGGSLPLLDETSLKRVSEVIHHQREAIRLDPARFGSRKKTVDTWEDALVQYKRADRDDMARREGLVKAMHQKFEDSRAEEEEDRQVENENKREL
jgi:tetratricopeptide (TPR) repeat protein